VPVSAERREELGIEAGHRARHRGASGRPPADLTAGLTPSQQRGFVAQIEQAKKAETRRRRSQTTIDGLRAGNKR